LTSKYRMIIIQTMIEILQPLCDLVLFTVDFINSSKVFLLVTVLIFLLYIKPKNEDRKIDLLEKASIEDNCKELIIFYKASKQFDVPKDIGQIIKDYTKYRHYSGTRKVLPYYVRHYLRKRFKC